jgi:hypothetical protein
MEFLKPTNHLWTLDATWSSERVTEECLDVTIPSMVNSGRSVVYFEGSATLAGTYRFPFQGRRLC